MTASLFRRVLNRLTRRDFLKRTATTGAALAASGALAQVGVKSALGTAPAAVTPGILATFQRFWGWSASCAPITGAVAIVDITGDVSCMDNLYGANAYGIQLNMTTKDGGQVQVTLQNMRGGVLYASEQSPNGQGISDTNPGYLFQGLEPGLDMIHAGNGFMLSFTQLPNKAGMLFMFWQRINGAFHGSPIYNVLPTAYDIATVGMQIVGMGEGSMATFTSGSFAVQLKLQGISDATYGGIDWVNTYTPPAVCGSYPLQTLENSNLNAYIMSLSAANGFFTCAYGVA